MEDLKSLGRYLLGRPSLALRHEQQRMPANIHVSVDSECAADRATRKSTTGMVQRLGRHPIKTTSNLETSVGLNVSERDFYALVHAAAYGLGLDSSSAKASASRRGLGKQRHVQTRYLWI